MKYTKSLRVTDEKGFASLIIALIIIIVLGLLTVGFAELMRHSSQQALNRQLSDQAYYAAESGVNDAVRAIKAGFTDKKTNCTAYTSGDPSWSKYFSSQLTDPDDTTNSPRWTCLLINPHPTSIKYDSISTVEPKVMTVKPIGGSGTMTLHISWQGASGTDETHFKDKCSDNSCFPVESEWNKVGASSVAVVGALRIAITPLTDLSRSGLIGNTYTAFLYPCDSNQCATRDAVGNANNTGYSSGNGQLVNGSCSTTISDSSPKYCNATIENVPVTSKGYLIRLRSLYSPTSVDISGVSGGTDVQFSGVQTLIDSTGKAQDVLKRIQVRVPTKPEYEYPGFAAVGTGAICKQIAAAPDIFSDVADSSICSIASPKLPSPGGGSPSSGGGGSTPSPGGGTPPGANFHGCPGAPLCPPSSGGGTPHTISYWANFVNTTSSPDATAANVKSCSWDFGDGTVENNTACYTGENISHQFFPGGREVPPSCYRYTVTLEVVYNSGDKATKVQNVNMPGGTESPCR